MSKGSRSAFPSLFLIRQNTLFDVGRSTCPQCLEAVVRQIKPLDLQIYDDANSTHGAWQAGVRCSTFIFSAYSAKNNLALMGFVPAH
jgi:hypothetical protein